MRGQRALKAASHSTIFEIPIRPMREDQRHRRRSTRFRAATPVMIIIPLNFARCTLLTHRNRQVKSALKVDSHVSANRIRPKQKRTICY